VSDRPEGQKSGAAKLAKKNSSGRVHLSPLLAFARHYRHLLMEMPVLPRSWLMIGTLPSSRHEVFAQAVASGMSASKSYALAYSRPPNGATRASAARLLTNANVKHRVAELRRGAAEQAKASLQALIPALDERARAAIATGRMREGVEILKRLAEIAAQAPARPSLTKVGKASE